VPEKSKTVQRRLVYGEYSMHESFAVLDATLAEGLSREIEAIQACATVGQARALEPTLKFTWLPGNDFEDDDGEPLPNDSPYDCTQTVAAQDGDWPMPDQHALEGLSSELLKALITRAGAGVHHTMLNGSYFAIPLEREADMVDVLRSAGFEVSRDDDLVANIGLQY